MKGWSAALEQPLGEARDHEREREQHGAQRVDLGRHPAAHHRVQLERQQLVIRAGHEGGDDHVVQGEGERQQPAGEQPADRVVRLAEALIKQQYNKEDQKRAIGETLVRVKDLQL